MGQQIRQVLVTYLTHRWVMAGIAAWFVLVLGPQLGMAVVSNRQPANFVPLINTIVGMPLLFLSLMLVPQAKAQFAHCRSALTPGFVLPHAVVLAGLLLLLVVVFPLAVAWCCSFDPVGMTALAAAIAATIILSVHFNRMGGMVLGLGVFYSTMTTAGANWWLLQADSHHAVHAAILLASVCGIVFWLVRLGQLREEMDDYQTTVQWRAARKSGVEVSEQRRIVAAQLRRSKLASWVSDAWLAGIGNYRDRSLASLARLLRYGFGQPAELGALFMAIWFFAITLFLAKYSFAAGSSASGTTLFYTQVAMLFPGMFAGEWLAQRRPRIATELLLPLSRERLVNGLFAATAWNAAAYWFILNAGLVLLTWLTASDRFTAATVGMMLLLTASGAFGLASLSLRTSVWPSVVKRLGVLMITMFLFQAPLLIWSLARERIGDTPFLVAPVFMLGFGGALIALARKEWLELELG